MSHTILLIQINEALSSKMYLDYESINDCMDGVCKLYEEYLKRNNPQQATIIYDISKLFHFVDELADISCLVYEESVNMYAPYPKSWIKQKLYLLLMDAATQSVIS